MKKRFLRSAAVLAAAALLCPGTASAAENDAQKTELYKYLAELDGVSLDECIILKDEFLTPNQPYFIEYVQCSPCRVYVQQGTTLDKDAVFAKWEQMLKANGYDYVLSPDDITFEESDGYYLLTDRYNAVRLTECLHLFPNVKRIDVQYGYAVYPHDEGGYNIMICSDRALTAADFPALKDVNLIKLSEIYDDEYRELFGYADNWEELWTFDAIPAAPDTPHHGSDTDAYKVAFKTVSYLLSLDYVHDLTLGFWSSGVYGDDMLKRIPEWETVFCRGDVNENHTVDVSDAVMLARFCVEDPEVTLTNRGKVNADADSSDDISLDDVTAILRIIAKKN